MTHKICPGELSKLQVSSLPVVDRGLTVWPRGVSREWADGSLVFSSIAASTITYSRSRRIDMLYARLSD